MNHYEHAPITETLIDIHFQGPAVSLEDLAALQEQEGSGFSEKKPVYLASLKFGDSPAGEPPAFSENATTQMGWAFIAADKLHVWQVRQGGFTLSRLAPYQSWKPFRDEAKRLWDLARPLCKPEAFTRIGLRTVNRIELPLPFADFKEFLKTTPEVSPELPQALNAFFMQLQIFQSDIEALLILNQQLLAPVVNEGVVTAVPILLDIDLFKDRNLPQNEDGVWELLEKLHSKRNEIFEGCITDKTRDLIR